MKPKTLEKILRRFERFPLHFIDTGIFVEALKDTKLGNQCSDYLNRIGYKYRGVISLSVLGEYALITYRDIKDWEGRETMFSFVGRIVNKGNTKYKTLDFDSNSHIEKVREIDGRIEFTDAQHLASAIDDKADSFVTFDKVLLDNAQEIERRFGLKIIHPKNL